MYHKTLCITGSLLFLCGCSQVQAIPEQHEEFYLQEIAHLHVEETIQEIPEDTQMKAIWIPMMLYESWMEGQSEDEFRTHVRNAFQNCADLGLNTVFLHARAYCDAYYDSELFPKGIYLTDDYDPLAIMIEEAHALNLNAHAWINPLRAMTPETLANLDESYLLRQWYDDPDKNGTYLVNHDGRYYLNPAYPEVRQLIADGAAEIIQNYPVDGIHIDDYFYPTTDPEFDSKAFSESSASDLAEWRRENISEMIQLLYQTVKDNNPEIPFSISPQGNFTIDYDELYADVRLWATEPGYCDILIPQIYYGFENQNLPFAETVELWAETVTVPELVIGLGTYKTGFADQWAGSGENEFLNDSSVIPREIEFVFSQEDIDGIALYSYTSLFEPEQEVAEIVHDELAQIAELLHKNTAPEISGAES